MHPLQQTNEFFFALLNRRVFIFIFRPEIGFQILPILELIKFIIFRYNPYLLFVAPIFNIKSLSYALRES